MSKRVNWRTPAQKAPDQVSVGGESRSMCCFQPVGVGIDDQRLLAVGHALVLVVMNERAPLHGTQFAATCA